MSKLEEIVDELGELNERLTPALMEISKRQERVKILESQLRAELKLPPDMPEIILGARYGCKVSAKRNVTKIKSMGAAMRAVKAAGHRAIDLFTITLEKLEKALSPAVYETLTATDRTGPRALETYRLVENKAKSA
jgi:hypothetical protein